MPFVPHSQKRTSGARRSTGGVSALRIPHHDGEHRHVAERELIAFVEDEKTELSALEANVKQSEMLEVGLRVAVVKARREALAVLTPEQREKAKSTHEQRMHEMMSGGHGPMPGQVQ